MPRRIRSNNGYRKFSHATKSMANIASTAATALKIATTVAGLINVEFKYVDVDGTLSPDTAGAIVHLTPVAQGDSEQQRDGNEVKAKSIAANWTITQHASGANTIVRLIWFIDLQGTTIPAGVNLLEGVDVNSHRNLDNRKRFVILKDEVIDFGDRTVHHGKWYRKLDMQILWNGSTGASYVSNHIYLLHLSTEATNKPTLLIKNRIRFLDN